MKTHFTYLVIIAVLSFFAFDLHKSAPIASTLNADAKIVQNEKGYFYAFLRPNDPKLYIQEGYQPLLEFKKIDKIVFPFIKGTDNLLVCLNTSGGAEQWLWNSLDHGNVVPHDLQFEEVYSYDFYPEQYRTGIQNYNSQGENGPDGFGKIILRGLFHESEFTRSRTRVPYIDFSKL